MRILFLDRFHGYAGDRAGQFQGKVDSLFRAHALESTVPIFPMRRRCTLMSDNLACTEKDYCSRIKMRDKELAVLGCPQFLALSHYQAGIESPQECSQDGYGENPDSKEDQSGLRGP